MTWFSPLDGDNTLSAALLDFFNEMNEDGTLARIEEKYLGHGDDFDYVDTRTFLRAVDAVLPQLKPLFEKYAEEIDWRLLAAIAYQESHWDAKIPRKASALRIVPMPNRASAVACVICRI